MEILLSHMVYKELLKSIYALPSLNEKNRAHILVVLTFFMALLEMASVASILPFLSVLSDPGKFKKTCFYFGFISHWLQWRKRYYCILDFAWIIIIFFHDGINFVSFFYSMAGERFYRNDEILPLVNAYYLTLLESVMNSFFTVDNANLAKTVLSETDVLVQNVVKSVFNMFAYIMVLVFLVVLLTLYNPLVAITSFLILLILYLFMFKSLSSYIKVSGNNILMLTQNDLSTNEIFTNIKYIKMIGQEASFEQEFSRFSSQIC